MKLKNVSGKTIYVEMHLRHPDEEFLCDPTTQEIKNLIRHKYLEEIKNVKE